MIKKTLFVDARVSVYHVVGSIKDFGNIEGELVDDVINSATSHVAVWSVFLFSFASQFYQFNFVGYKLQLSNYYLTISFIIVAFFIFLFVKNFREMIF